MRTFRSEKYLSLPKEDASGEVAPDDLPDHSITIEDVKVVAATITCYKCGMEHFTEKCKPLKSANILIENGNEYIQLTAFDGIFMT